MSVIDFKSAYRRRHGKPPLLFPPSTKPPSGNRPHGPQAAWLHLEDDGNGNRTLECDGRWKLPKSDLLHVVILLLLDIYENGNPIQ